MQPDNNLTSGSSSENGPPSNTSEQPAQPGAVVTPLPGQSFAPQNTSPGASNPGTSPEAPASQPASAEPPVGTVPSVPMNPPAVSNTPPASVGQPPVMPGAGTAGSFNQPPAKSNNKKVLKLVIVVAAALLLIGGGSAAAYFGYVVPNKPETILRDAFENTLKQKQITYDGNLALDPADPKADDAFPSIRMTLKGSEDVNKHATSGQFKITVTGIDLSFDVRYVDQNLYFKLGDLATIKSVLLPYVGAVLPNSDGLFDIGQKTLSNKWIEVDSTLLKEAGGSCVLDANMSFSDSDIQVLQDQFQKNPFITIDSHSNDQVNGKAAQKYQLTIDDDKGAQYAKGLKNLSIVKELDKCTDNGLSQALGDDSTLKDGGKTPITIWVDKATKKISKIGLATTDADAKKDNLKGTFEVTLSYGAVNVTAPEGAVPALQVVTDLQKQLQQQYPELMDLFGGNFSTDLQDVESL